MGTLQIGDQRAAILQIQASQTDPQKALSELVENCIDAKARNIHITRRKHHDQVEIIVKDDGEGVRPGNDGSPDFDRVANHICDSFKKNLDAHEKNNVQGEFGIGMLGFAAIADNLEMLSRTDLSKTKFLTLKAFSDKYDTGWAKKELNNRGTEVKIWPVRKDIKARLTADKISLYLGQELRERIKESQVNITVEDKLAGGKTRKVVPQDYKGERISSIEKVNTISGNIHFKLYITQEGDIGNVSVYRRGTKILDNIASIPDLDHHPWTSEMVEGFVDSRFLNVSPATRRGIVPDEKLSEFIRSVKSIESLVNEEIKKAEARREEKLSQETIKSLQEAFADVMRDLPNEYNWFDIKKGGIIPGSGRTFQPSRPKPVRISSGPLDTVSIFPQISQVEPNESKIFIAKSWTTDRALIPIGVQYKWHISQVRDFGSITAQDNSATFQSGFLEGEVTLKVDAIQGNNKASAEAKILIIKKSPKAGKLSFLNIKGVEKPGELWRCRWLEETQTLEYNIGHPNYLQAQKRGTKQRLRYIAFLIAKHLVLHNFKKAGEENVLERMIEVITTLETRI